ncbi:2-amino-4-hydroxy-6-hydroxymethyldihydropteridine pyrophosphokinase [Jeotgalibacillus alimentarius]|uniref:2-amino-4-hydroxy-6-hydroxymethyldihydropteridine diphosphokinase n=1 Tax=Jeotgalibacillus alimentarius TaxID=135826 RepID=A0A0C2VY18_9BACL|nr:2-amino-4-hydroxy-6-hydroxymethyldihydropteridine diphosphokinase [Jeotgalibacillus alimentarius]KIL53737.1 2-amino-4-hydroxy-6-hydroxymethyldihydropteridine pyrophosphokinase [Jeotgalibacillus alimentarius]
MVTAYLSLGSNIGDTKRNLQEAVKMLDASPSIEVTKVSSIYETDPVGFTDQQVFLNIVAEVKTELSAESLLDEAQRIEQSLGRERKIHWGPRTIDLDILLYHSDNIQSDRLTVPHPYMRERSFVLVPLNEIAAEAVHPASEKSVRELLNHTGSEGVRLWKETVHQHKESFLAL